MRKAPAKAKVSKVRDSKAKDSKAKESKAKEPKAKEPKAEESKTEESKANDAKQTDWLFEDMPPTNGGSHLTMKTLSIRLSESLFAEISREAESRKISKSEVIRERLETAGQAKQPLIDEMDDLECFELMANLLSFVRPEEEAA